MRHFRNTVLSLAAAGALASACASETFPSEVLTVLAAPNSENPGQLGIYVAKHDLSEEQIRFPIKLNDQYVELDTGEALAAGESMGLSFGFPSDSYVLELENEAGETKLRTAPLEVGGPFHVVAFGETNAMEYVAFDDRGTDVSPGQVLVRVTNITRVRVAGEVVVCPPGSGNDVGAEGCSVVEASLGYAETWTGEVARGSDVHFRPPLPEGASSPFTLSTIAGLSDESEQTTVTSFYPIGWNPGTDLECPFCPTGFVFDNPPAP